MTKITRNIFIIAFVAFCACSSSDTNNKNDDVVMKRYGIERACVEYTVSGQGQEGIEILYFDYWGAREAKYEIKKINVGPITQEIDKVTYLDGDMQYTHDRKDGTATKMQNAELKLYEGKDLVEVGEQMMKQMGGVKIKSEEFLGKMCDVWENKRLGMTIWVWEGITLKTITNMMGMNFNIIATKISLSFENNKVQRPNLDYQDIGGIMQN